MYNIVGSITYSSTANKNTALTNINNTLASYVTTPIDTVLPAGVQSSGNTVTISISCADDIVDTLRMALLTAWSSAARATTGHWISAVKQ